MHYMFLIHTDETQADFSPEAMAPWIQFGEKYAAKIQHGAPLQATSTATTVRVRENQTLTTDGPYAEVKEQLGGFYIIDCKDLDEALKIGSEIPAALNGAVEIRPVMEMCAPPQ